MKTTLLKISLLAAFLCAGVSAFAYETSYDFVVDGIYYKKNYSYWDSQAQTSINGVAVAPMASGSSINAAAYTGDVVIPSSVTYEGTDYPVVAVNSYAFYYCSGLTGISSSW